MAAKKEHYVKSADLESAWLTWLKAKDAESWESILTMVYKICFGATLKFSPREESEREEMAHDAFVATIGKIRDSKLKYVEGRGSAFNLVTTAVIRHIQSRKNREKAGKRVHERYIQKQMGSNDNLRAIRSMHRSSSRNQIDPNEEVPTDL
jgi:hypothetical protein